MNSVYRMLGRKLFDAAVQLSHGEISRKATRAAVRPMHKSVAKSGPRKGWTLARKIDEVHDAAAKILRLRQRRRWRSRWPAPWSAATLTPEERLSQQIESQLLQAYGLCGFRRASAGDHHYRGSVGDLPSARGESHKGERYSRGCTYRKTDSVHRLTVRRNWLSTVYRPGLAVRDGLLTLSAEATGDSVYRLVWVRQGAGFSLTTESGWLAVDGDVSYHSTKSAKAAATGLRRKLTIQQTPPEVLTERKQVRATLALRRRARQAIRLARRLLNYDLDVIGDVEVSLRDSLTAGNCEPGTLSFRDRYATGRDSATIREIADAIQTRGVNLRDWASVDLQLARQFLAACLVAIRRDRNAQRAI